MLADLYQQNDMSAEVEKMYQQALDGFEKVWGPDHLLVIMVIHSAHTVSKASFTTVVVVLVPA